MFSKRELLDAIKECEKEPKNYPDCAKLATFYAIYDHLYPDKAIEQVEETSVGDNGDTEFLKALSGCNAKDAWLVMDDLMSTIRVMQPRLYDGVLMKIEQAK